MFASVSDSIEWYIGTTQALDSHVKIRKKKVEKLVFLTSCASKHFEIVGETVENMMESGRNCMEILDMAAADGWSLLLVNNQLCH